MKCIRTNNSTACALVLTPKKLIEGRKTHTLLPNVGLSDFGGEKHRKADDAPCGLPVRLAHFGAMVKGYK